MKKQMKVFLFGPQKMWERQEAIADSIKKIIGLESVECINVSVTLPAFAKDHQGLDPLTLSDLYAFQYLPDDVYCGIVCAGQLENAGSVVSIVRSLQLQYGYKAYVFEWSDMAGGHVTQL